MNNSRKTRRVEWAAVLLVLVILAGTAFSFVHDRISYFSDSRAYIQCAESLAAGEGYSVDGKPAVTWPPCYSGALALLMALGIESVSAFKLLNIVVGLAALALWWRCLRRLTDRVGAVLVLAVSGLFFPWLYYSQTILAEILFSLWAALLFLFAAKFAEEERPGDLVVMTIGAMLAPVTKMAGLAFLAGWLYVVFAHRFRLVRLLAEKRWRAVAGSMAAAALVATPLAAWCIRNWLLTGSPTGYDLGATPEYLYSVEKIGVTDPTLLQRLWISVRGYSHILLVPDQSGIARIGKLPAIVNLACAGVSLAVFVGWLRGMTRRGHRTGAVLFGFLGGLLLLNSWYDIRYLLPIMPLYFLYLADAVGGGAALVARGVRRLVPLPDFLAREECFRWAILFVLAPLFLAFAIVSPQARRLRSPEYEDELQRMYEACRFVKNAEAPGDLLLAGGGGFVPVWSGRKAVSLLGRLDEAGNLKSLDIPDGVRFLLLSETKFAPYREKHMEPLVAANRNRLSEVFRDGDTIVYEVK